MKLNKFLKSVVATVLAVAMVVAAVPATPVEAASYTLATASKAKTIKKVGTYKVTVPANSKTNYILFKVPKNGTYNFTVGDLMYSGEAADQEGEDYWCNSAAAYDAGIEFTYELKSGKKYKQLTDGRNVGNIHSFYTTGCELYGFNIDSDFEEFMKACIEGAVDQEELTAAVWEAGLCRENIQPIKLSKGQVIRIAVMNKNCKYGAAYGMNPTKLTFTFSITK